MCWKKNKTEYHCLFKNERLSISIENNLFETDFFDVPYNLVTGNFSPFRKPNNLSLYINTKSNYPPTFIKSQYNNHRNSFPRWHRNKTQNFQDTSGHLETTRQKRQLHCKIQHSILCLNVRMSVKKVRPLFKKKGVIAITNQKNLLNKRTWLLSKCRY